VNPCSLVSQNCSLHVIAYDSEQNRPNTLTPQPPSSNSMRKRGGGHITSYVIVKMSSQLSVCHLGHTCILSEFWLIEESQQRYTVLYRPTRALKRLTALAVGEVMQDFKSGGRIEWAPLENGGRERGPIFFSNLTLTSVHWWILIGYGFPITICTVNWQQYWRL